MNKKTKNILAIAGIVSTGFGIVGAIPSFLQEKYGIAVASTMLIVGGLVLIAIAFGD